MLDEAKKTPQTVGAGRGLIYITFAKLWFMVGGYAIQFALPHLVDQARFGEWALILSWISPINNVMVTATIQAVSKFSSARDDAAEGAKRAALKLQVLFAGILGLAFFLGAPLIARVELDGSLIPGLRIVSGVVICYSFYAVFVGAANGTRQFHKQAGLDAAYSTLRAGFVIGGALFFHSVMGAISGFFLAAVSILIVSIVVVGFEPVKARVEVRELARFMIELSIYLMILNLLMFVDGWVVKRLMTESAIASGIANPATYASEQVAIYTSAQTFARLPYQLILSVTFIIFPLISRTTFSQDQAATRRYIERALRYSLIVVVAMAVAMAARPAPLVALFGKKYLAGAAALTPLAFGYVAFSIFSIAGTIINSAGLTLPTTIIGAITLVVDFVGTVAAVKWANATHHNPLAAAAIATAFAMALGAFISIGYLSRRFAASLSIVTIGRTLACAAAATALGRIVPVSGRAGLLACIVGGIAFVALLFVSRELSLSEIRALRSSRSA